MPNLRKEFAKIYDQYVDKIFRFVFLKVKSQDIAEDLCSEVFLRGWETFKVKNPEIGNIQAFLYQIARNLLADHYRATSKAQLVSTEYAPIIDPSQDLEEKAIVNSEIDQVKGVLANLKSDYREVIIWYYLDELKVGEIAKILNKSEPAVRVLIHRALTALKNEVKYSTPEVE